MNSSTAATLKHLAAAGDMTAKALVEGVKDILLTAGVEAVNVIKVSGRIVDGVGNPKPGVQNILAVSKPVSGVGTMTDGGAGTIIAGSASVSVWMQTDATGAFQLDVLNAVAEVNLVQVTTDNGDVAQIVLTFA